MSFFIGPEWLVNFVEVGRCPVLTVLGWVLDRRSREVTFLSSAAQNELGPHGPLVMVSAAASR